MRPEAWRCTVGNEIHDPCFEAAANTVVCPLDGPWTNTGLRIALTVPLPRDRANTLQQGMGQPWALQLADGSRCELLGGATGVVDGMRLNYACNSRLNLYGNPDRSARPWTIFAGAENATQLTTREVTIAWY